MPENADERKNKYAWSGNRTSVKDNDDIINVSVDAPMLNMICKYVLSTNAQVHRTQLVNLKQFIDQLDHKQFENDNDKLKRLEFINRALEARLIYNLDDPELVIRHVNGGLTDPDFIDIGSFKELTAAEMNWIGGMISDGIKFNKIYNLNDRMLNTCLKIKSLDYGNKRDLIKEFEGLTNNIQNEFRKCRNKSTNEVEFGLGEEEFDSSIHDVYIGIMNPSRRLITGMQGLNEMVGGGFESGRVYVFFGLPGEGKSLTLLSLMYQIKKYNRSYKTKDPTKRPCLVLLTMENTVAETVERLYDIVSSGDDMCNHTEEEIKKDFKMKGELYLSPDSPIDIKIKYMPTNSIDTSYLYTMVDDYADQGLEVIGVFMDYLGRIRAENHNLEQRLELGNVADEFKIFAAEKDIPVITAHQLNREASKHIDEARQNNKNDLVRLLGRSNISDSINILNNVDGCFSITPEYPSTGGKYLGIQKMKLRTKNKTDLEFVYLPYISKNSARMVEDVGAATPTYLRTLKPQDIGCVQRKSQYAGAINEIPIIDQEFDDPNDDLVFFHTGSMMSSDNGQKEAQIVAALRQSITIIHPITFKKPINPIKFH